MTDKTNPPETQQSVDADRMPDEVWVGHERRELRFSHNDAVEKYHGPATRYVRAVPAQDKDFAVVREALLRIDAKSRNWKYARNVNSEGLIRDLIAVEEITQEALAALERINNGGEK